MPTKKNKAKVKVKAKSKPQAAKKPAKSLASKVVGKISAALKKSVPKTTVVAKKITKPSKASKPSPAPAVVAKKANAKVPAKPAVKELKDKKGKKSVVVVEVEARVPKGKAAKKQANGAHAGSGKVKEAKKRCREAGCDHDPLITGFCRLHYIKNWRKIKRKEAILNSGQLNNYVEELVTKYPDKYLDVIRQDLSSEKEWTKVVTDLELDSPDDEFGADDDSDGAPEGAGKSDRGFDDDSDDF